MEKRLLFVTTGLGWGGAESQVIDLAIGFHKRRWQVHVVSLLSEAERKRTLEDSGVPVSTLGMSRGLPDPRGIWRLAALVRSFRPSIVHSHMVHANILARLTRMLVRMPVLVSTAHNVNEGRGWRPLAYRLTDSLADLTTNVSQVAVKKFIADKAVPRERIRFMPNGIDFTKFRRDVQHRVCIRKQLGVESSFVWLAVGRLEPQKDYANMINAFARLIKTSSRARLLIAGDGLLREDVTRQVEKLGLENHVVLLGLRTDIPELMSAADAYVMSSAWEGLPVVLLEAAASELPIVATDVGGNSQIVQNGLTGNLVPSGDSSALADAMVAVMEKTDSDRAQMGANARAHVEEMFGLESVLDQWEQVYHELWSDIL